MKECGTIYKGIHPRAKIKHRTTKLNVNYITNKAWTAPTTKHTIPNIDSLEN